MSWSFAHFSERLPAATLSIASNLKKDFALQFASAVFALALWHFGLFVHSELVLFRHPFASVSFKTDCALALIAHSFDLQTCFQALLCAILATALF